MVILTCPTIIRHNTIIPICGWLPRSDLPPVALPDVLQLKEEEPLSALLSAEDVKETALNLVVRRAHEVAGVNFFYTTGEDETGVRCTGGGGQNS